jgi:NAD(P)-dependent dehydrogenase (short-subunit alcohol dehydrogenase family)
MRKEKDMTHRTHERVAIVAGVGPGLGAALVKKLTQEGCRVGIFARSPKFIGKLAAELVSRALAVPTDISDPKQVATGFRKVREKLSDVEILIAHASDSLGKGLVKTTPDEFERSWRIAVFGAFLFTRSRPRNAETTHRHDHFHRRDFVRTRARWRGRIQRRRVRRTRARAIPRRGTVA